ncbi:MAG TPA: SBBP repeat-containing protein [Bryobacteraceae bacterium]|nr:SBBP repeat-containing protein [Bryobacteraceae bacterium]
MVTARHVCGVAIAALASAGIIFTAFHTHHSSSRRFDQPPTSRSYANLPVNFIENAGQTDPRVRFYSHGAGFAFFVTAQEAVFRFEPRPSSRTTLLTRVRDNPGDKGAILRLRFLNGNPNVIIQGEERAAGEVNYLLGDDSSRWQRGLSQYRQVRYRDLWPGIDMKLREESGRLKYEFQVRPGARVADIRLAYKGADSLELDTHGGLMIGTPLGVLRDSPPIAYQEIAGVRVPVGSRYDLTGSSYGFNADGYDSDRELIIDPGLEYSTFLGGASHDYGSGIVVDTAGNAYVVGVTQSPDFPATAGAFDRTGAASNNLDVFVTKINPTGTALIYSTFVGGTNFEWGRGIAIDSANNVYVTGQTKSANFPTTGGAFDRTFNVDTCPRCGIDQYDAFVFKLNAAGSSLSYSTFLGGFDIDDGMAIAVDSAGSAYVAGETGSGNFPTTNGAISRVRNGEYDAFVSKLNPTGSALVYSTYLGGSLVDFAQRIALSKDGTNNAYVVGSTRSPDFPTTPGAFDTTANGEFDIFVARLNPSGTALIYSTFLGGSGMDGPGGLAVDADGNAYIGGGTPSANFPVTPGAFSTVLTGSSDAFVSKLNAAGNSLIFSTLLGGSGNDGINALVLDAAANLYVAGITNSADFPMTPTAFDSTFNGGFNDAFIAKFNPGATALLYSTFLGGSDNEGASDMAIDSARSVYVTGQTMSGDFPTTPGAPDRVWNGDPLVFWADAFVAKLTPVDGPGTTPVFSLATVTTNPSAVTGGTGSTGTVSVNAPAPANVVVSLASSDPNVVSIPASATIAQGASSANVAITTSPVTTGVAVTISASYNGVTKTTTLSILTPPPSPILTNLVTSPSTVTGGDSVTGAVVLSMAVWNSGFPVALSSNHPAASTPASVTVPQGSQSAAFPITTTAVTTSTVATITATAAGVTKTTSLTINPPGPPPPPPPQTATLTVTATGRSGERVMSTPGGINVQVGTSGSASFNIGTSITLSVSNSRDAVWSSACSSSGQKTRSCSFTLNSNSAVTANVQ